MEENSLYFKVTADGAELQKTINEGVKGFDELGKAAEDASKEFDELFSEKNVFREVGAEMRQSLKMSIDGLKEGFSDFNPSEYAEKEWKLHELGGMFSNQGKLVRMAIEEVQDALKDTSATEEQKASWQSLLETLQEASKIHNEVSQKGMGDVKLTISAGESALSAQEIAEYEKKAADEAERLNKEYEEYAKKVKELGLENEYERSRNNQGLERKERIDTKEAENNIETLKQKVEDLQNTLDGSDKKFKDAQSTIKEYADTSIQGSTKIKELQISINNLADAERNISGSKDVIEQQKQALEELIGLQSNYAAILENRAKDAALSGDSEEAEKYKQQAEAVRAEIEQTRAQYDAAKESLQSYTQAIADASAQQERYTSVMEAAREAGKVEDIGGGNTVQKEVDLGSIQEKYNVEKEAMRALEEEMDNLIKKRDELQQKVESGKLSDEKTEQATQEIQTLGNEIDVLSQKYQVASERAAQFKQAATDGLGEGLNNLKELPVEAEKSVGETTDKFARLKEAMMGISGGFGGIMRGFKLMASGGAGAANGLGMVVKGFKTLKATLVSNPIGAIIAVIVVAVKQLVEAFKRNEQAMTALKKITAPFKAIWQQIQRLFDDIVKIFVKVFNTLSKGGGSFSEFITKVSPLPNLIEKIRKIVAVLGTALNIIAKVINAVSKVVGGFVEKVRSYIQQSVIGQFIQGVIDTVHGLFNQLASWIEGIANSKLGKKLGFDELYNDLKAIGGAQDELTEKNKQLADMEQALAENKRKAMTEEAELEAEMLKLQEESANAAGNATKQLEIGKQISEKQKQIDESRLGIAEQELAIIQMKNSLIQPNSAALDEEAEKSAEVIKLRAQAQHRVSSQERSGLRRSASAAKREENEAAKTQREINKDIAKAAEERIKIENSRIQAERLARKAELDLQIKQIREEEKAWSEAHKGRKNKSFAMRIENVKLQYQIDTENADKQFKEWKEKFERQILNIDVNMELAVLEQRIELEDDAAKKIELQNQLFERQLQLKEQEIALERDEYLKSQYGDKTLEAYNKFGQKDLLKGYANASAAEKASMAKSMGLSQEMLATFAEMDAVADKYDQMWQRTKAQMEQEKIFADLRKDYEEYQNYSQQILDLAKWREEELEKIRLGESTKTAEEVEKLFNDKLNAATRDMNIDPVEEGMGNLLQKFITDIAGATDEAIQNAFADFEKAIKDENAEIDRILNLSPEDKAAERSNLEDQYQELNLEAMSTDDVEKQNELYAQMEELKRRITLLDMSDADLITQQSKNTSALRMAEQESYAEREKGNKLSKEWAVKFTSDTTHAVASLEKVKDIASNVANTFGGSLSKGAKKALNTVMGIAEAGIDAVNGISEVVSTATKGMEVAAATGIASMTALEKASFILTILSVAVQVVTKLVEVFTQFTRAAQLQDAIDEQKEHIESLEHEHEKLERAYKNSYGTEYYRKMAQAAEDYNQIIEANNQALYQAEQLYKEQVAAHGEDSDKAREAKEQYEELEQQRDDYIDKQRETYAQMMEELSGTNLKQFSQNIASALVDGFEQGRDGINDVWEDTMDDLMKKMITNQLALAIENMFKPVFDDLNDYTKNGELSQSEIDAIMAEFDAKSEQAKVLAERYYNIMEERGLLDGEDSEGSQGFGQMTQDQADTLTARFTALQMEGANLVAIGQSLFEGMTEMRGLSERQTNMLQDISQYQQMAFLQSQEHLDQLRIIADNTSLLTETNSRLKSIEQNTDKL